MERGGDGRGGDGRGGDGMGRDPFSNTFSFCCWSFDRFLFLCCFSLLLSLSLSLPYIYVLLDVCCEHIIHVYDNVNAIGIAITNGCNVGKFANLLLCSMMCCMWWFSMRWFSMRWFSMRCVVCMMCSMYWILFSV